MKFEDLKVGMWIVEGGDRARVGPSANGGRRIHWDDGGTSTKNASTWKENTDARPLTLADLAPGERFTFADIPPLMRKDWVFHGDRINWASDPGVSARIDGDWGDRPVSLVPGEAMQAHAEIPYDRPTRQALDNAGWLHCTIPWDPRTTEQVEADRQLRRSVLDLGRVLAAIGHGYREWMHNKAEGAPMDRGAITTTGMVVQQTIARQWFEGLQVPDFTHPRTLANRKPDIVLGIDWD